ncbi:MAG: pseudouridine synthase [Prosthecobacter sp.]
MRLNRYLSQCGVASRRGAEEIILGGRVSINGHVITELATQVQPDDKVVVDGSPVRTEQPIVIVMNKPKGYICSRGDTHERMTIYDLLPLKFQTLHHVGRLDKDSEGLILLTNRGDLSHRIIHPSQGAEKEYEVVVDQAMTIDTMGKMAKGMLTEEGYARAERAWLDGAYKAHVVLKQGLKRQIRLMFYHLGYEVVRLTRIRIGWLQLRGLSKGSWKELTPTEVERFFKAEAQKGREPPPKMPKSATKRPNRYAPASPRTESQDDSWGDEGESRPQQSERAPGRRARKTAAAKRAAGSSSFSEGKSWGPKPTGSGSSFGKPASKRAFKRPRSGETGPDERPRGRSGSKPARRPAPQGDRPRRRTR